MGNIIRVNHLVKRYGAMTAVDDISFNIVKGDCFGLLGPNGAGKTTTIEMLEGIIDKTSGDIYYDDEPLSPGILHKIGIQFQQTALQDFLTVKETLKLFAAFYQQTLPLDELIAICDLSDILTKDNRVLSGGQRQRLLLALALINDPDIIFLDEPTTGLDPQSRRNFWQLITNIKQRNKTIVLTTHYMDEAEQLCDQLVIMEQGKIIEQGSPQQLLHRHFDQVFIYLPIDNVPNALRQQSGWQIKPQGVEIQTQNVEATLAQLVAANVSLTGLQVKSANLDDLFLKLTGHSIRD
jgi:ABC-2 type transport system ATP-binding protein